MPSSRRQYAVRRRRMQLDPRAVKAFYERELEDWRWLKSVPHSELLKLVPKGFSFITDPRSHQLACFILASKLQRFLFMLEMGSGKSKLLLDLIRLRKFQGELQRALICMPNIINLASWENQLLLHAPDLTYTVLSGTKKDRYAALDKAPTDVYLINYAGLPVYMASNTRKTKKGTRRKDMVVEDAIEFSNLFNFLGLDECHTGLSSVKALNYTLTKTLSWRADFCYGLTGTPMGRDPEKLWPQFHVIDEGETLGHSLQMFHSAYFREKENHWTTSGTEYVFDNRKRLQLHKATQHRSLRYTDKEFADMPALMPAIPIYAPMSSAQMKRNEELLAQAMQASAEGEHAPATFTRQRQTTAGFIAVKAEDDVRLEVAFKPNPKVNALEQFLLDLDPEEKLVIFHSYVYSGVLIAELLQRLKIEYSGVGRGYKDPALSLRRFRTDPRCRVFVANCMAGGTGVDGLQDVCRYAVFYESPTGPTQRRQAEKRLHRDGQKRRVYLYDIIARGISVDQRVLDSIAEGVDLFEAVVNGKEQVK